MGPEAMAYSSMHSRIVDIAKHSDEYMEQRRLRREISRATRDAGFSIFGYEIAFSSIREGIELSTRLACLLDEIEMHNTRVTASSMRVPTEGLEYVLGRVDWDLDDNFFSMPSGNDSQH